MNDHRSKHPNLTYFNLMRESSKYEGQTSGKREEIVEEMGENFPRRNRNVNQNQNQGGGKTRIPELGESVSSK